MAEAKKPVDWEAIEKDYRAGLKTHRQIAEAHGVSHTAIQKRAKQEQWSRDLSAKIKQRANEKVAKEQVAKSVAKEAKISEQQVIEANASAIADVIRGHRSGIVKGMSIVKALFEELESQTHDRELYSQLGELLYAPDNNGIDKLNEIYRKAMSLPSRTDTVKKLAEALKSLIAIERESFGLDREDKRPADPYAEMTDDELESRLANALRKAGAVASN